MKMTKKLFAILLAVMMLAVCATAWATATEEEIGDDGIASNGDKTNGFNDLYNTITFPKNIIVYNDDDDATVYGPKITYTYTLTSATVSARSETGVTITDADGDVGTVYTGVAAAISTGSSEVEFDNETVTGELTKGVAIAGSNDISFTFDPTKFPHAGVFRYLVTESVETDAREEAGVETVGTYAETRYLDVYVHNTADGLKIYGYVLFEPGDDAADENITDSTTSKSAGYVNTADSVTSIDDVTDVDVFYTDNLTISKTTTGLGDKTHEFPFYVTLTQGTGSDVDPDLVQVTVDGTQMSLTDAIADGITARGMKDGDTMTIIGIPRNAIVTASVYEKNDTWDEYKLSTEVNGTAGLDAVVIGHNKYSGGTTDCADGASAQEVVIGTTDNDGEDTIDFTNDLAEISPTGLVIRFAPYALILIGGIALLLISKKHKKHVDTDEE